MSFSLYAILCFGGVILLLVFLFLGLYLRGKDQ